MHCAKFGETVWEMIVLTEDTPEFLNFKVEELSFVECHGWDVTVWVILFNWLDSRNCAFRSASS